MLQNLVCEYEKLTDPRLPACSRKSGNLLETCCTIMDLKGVGLSKFSSAYGYVQAASAISQNYYPERLGKFYLINAPWGFSGVFSVVKKFLDPVTVAKIHVLGSGYKSELLAQVPAESLPKEFGGSCSCEGGCQLSDQGPCELWRFMVHVRCVKVLMSCLQGKIRNGRRRLPGRRKTTTASQRPRATLERACHLVQLVTRRLMQASSSPFTNSVWEGLCWYC